MALGAGEEGRRIRALRAPHLLREGEEVAQGSPGEGLCARMLRPGEQGGSGLMPWSARPDCFSEVTKSCSSCGTGMGTKLEQGQMGQMGALSEINLAIKVQARVIPDQFFFFF